MFMLRGVFSGIRAMYLLFCQLIGKKYRESRKAARYSIRVLNENTISQAPVFPVLVAEHKITIFNFSVNLDLWGR